jgi:hypothetical protein
MTIPVNPNAPISLLLHPNELDYIAKCLHSRPYGEVAPLLAKMQNQVIAQQFAAANPEPNPEPGPAPVLDSEPGIEPDGSAID